jgi:hypothetical protein
MYLIDITPKDAVGRIHPGDRFSAVTGRHGGRPWRVLWANWRHHAVSLITGFTAANGSLSQRTAPPK